MSEQKIIDRLERDLDTLCDAMTALHPIGRVKHIGRRELVKALRDVLVDVSESLPSERDLRRRALNAIAVIDRAKEAAQ